ncbi:MAG: hypothetical protein GY869_02080, partial [Planctomycetes bacterium]|nr:hypothetical protein [Planctomycetota bacterium]
TITNCVVWGNSPAAAYNCTASFNYCCLEWIETGTGNMSVNPEFVGLDDYHISNLSLCIDAGTNNLPGLLSPEDIDGNPRLIDGDNDQLAVVDMGAYEIPLYPVAVFELSVQHFDLEYQIGGPQPLSRSFDIRNRGGSTLRWDIIADCDWLNINPQNGVSTGEITTVNIALEQSKLEAGRHQCELTISDPNAYNNPQQVSVSLYVSTKGHRLVPEEYETIQAAIDAADEYDKVIVAPGIYQENILLNGKNIELTSLDPNDSSLVVDTVI